MEGRNFLIIGVACLFLWMAQPGYAYMQEVYITGTVDVFNDAAGTNLTAVGSTWTGYATYDDTRPPTAPAIRRNPDLDALTLTINDFGWGVLTETLGEGYPAFPEMVFLVNTGELVDVLYEYDSGAYFFTLGGTNLGNLEWKISGYTGGSAPLVFGTIEVSTVPIPGGIWLLVAGLLGLIGFRRRLVRA